MEWEGADALSTMETIPVRFPGTREDEMMGEVEPLVSRVMKRRCELAARELCVSRLTIGSTRTSEELLNGV